MNKNRKRLIKQWKRFTKIHDEKIMFVREPYHIQTVKGECFLTKEEIEKFQLDREAKEEVIRQITNFLKENTFLLNIRENPLPENPNIIKYSGEIKVAYAPDSSFFE